MIRILCRQVSQTVTTELDYWPSLRHTAATGCTLSLWLHVEQDSTTRQRAAVGLRLGVNLCEPHMCPCGTLVDAKGSHELSCKRNAGRSIRNHQLDDLIWRALTRASIPWVNEPVGLFRSDGKRTDGLNLIPWQGGKCLTWNVTVADTLAATYLASASTTAASVAEGATSTSREDKKYSAIAQSHVFVPLAIETLGLINLKGLEFLFEMGDRLTTAADDPRDASFLFQRISIVIERFNAICF